MGTDFKEEEDERRRMRGGGGEVELFCLVFDKGGVKPLRDPAERT